MTKEIKVNRAVVAHLKQKFEVTQQAVWYALHFVSNSTKAVMIREDQFGNPVYKVLKHAVV